MNIKDAVIGHKVVYTPFARCHPDDVKEGVITSVNDKFVFVRYGADANSKATRAEDISIKDTQAD